MLSRRQFLAASFVLAAGGPSVLAATRKLPLQLGLVADVQFADIEPSKTRFYRQSIQKLTEAVECFNTLDLKCCVSLGDLIDRHWESFDAVLKPIAKCRHTFHHLLGNHDFGVPDELKAKVPKRLGLKHRYYSIQDEGFQFVMLDTSDVSPYAHPEASKENREADLECKRMKAAGAPNAQSWNGAVGERQLKWFDENCRSAARKGRKVIVFSHHQVFPPDPHCEWNSSALLKVVEQNPNVVAWINGHNHAGAFGVHAGVPFITLHAMVETRDTTAFAELRLHSDRLELVGHGRELSRDLGFRGA
jgi:manganese-dependent ADP-ribose/CDP-alcohol diphosphatase